MQEWKWMESGVQTEAPFWMFNLKYPQQELSWLCSKNLQAGPMGPAKPYAGQALDSNWWNLLQPGRTVRVVCVRPIGNSMKFGIERIRHPTKYTCFKQGGPTLINLLPMNILEHFQGASPDPHGKNKSRIMSNKLTPGIGIGWNQGRSIQTIFSLGRSLAFELHRHWSIFGLPGKVLVLLLSPGRRRCWTLFPETFLDLWATVKNSCDKRLLQVCAVGSGQAFAPSAMPHKHTCCPCGWPSFLKP